MKKVILFIVAIVFASIAQQGNKTDYQNYIDRWLDIVDTKTEIELEMFNYQSISSGAIWTEASGDSILKWNVKMIDKNKTGENSFVSPDYIPRIDLINFMEKWVVIPHTAVIHIGGKNWAPPFKKIEFRINGYMFGEFKIKSYWKLEEIKQENNR